MHRIVIWFRFAFTIESNMQNNYPNQRLILHKDIISPFKIHAVYLNRYLDERSKLSDLDRARLIVKRKRYTLIKR